MSDYREGDHPEVGMEGEYTHGGEQQESSNKSESTRRVEHVEGKSVPVTAFLVTQQSDGRLQAIVELDNIVIQRKASPRDVRDMCRALAADMQMLLTSQMVQSSFSNSIKTSIDNSMVQRVRMGIPKH